MGEVYRARDTRLGREVAVKVLPAAFAADAERLRRFEQEARAASALNHPNILTIYDVGTHDGSPYVVSELLEGETLRDRLQSGPLPPRKAIDYARQVANGLAAAHEKGITHRDLKPENLFLTKDGRAKILDFGLAKLTYREESGGDQTSGPTISGETQPGTVLGTMGYMSPEQVRGQPADHRSDIFTFGAILYETLSGRRAFRGDTAADTMTAILKDDPPELSQTGRHIPPALERMVRHCLEKSPQERFQSAQDLAFALEALSASELISAPVAPAVARPRRWRLATLLGLALLGVFSLVWFFASRWIGKMGAGSAPTFRRLTFRRGTIPAARFHPDGQTIIYGAAWDGKPVELFTTRPEAPESRRLGIPGAGILAIFSSGEMAISQGCQFFRAECQGTLARVPLSGGAPREVLEDVFHADWPPDGKTLAVVRLVDSQYRLEYPLGKVLYETPGWICDARISPKGDRIAFLEQPVGVVDMWLSVVDLKGQKKTLSTGWKELRGLAWFGPEEIWFTAGKVAGAKALHSVTLSGRQRLLLRIPGNPILFDISRDGRLLLSRSEWRTQIMSLPPGATQERDLSWFDDSWTADLSSDGKALLSTELGEAVGSVPTVYLRKTDGSDAVKLGEGLALALSPDEKWALAKQASSPPSLMLLPTGAGQPKVLPRGSVDDFYWATWFPDGSRILFAGEGRDRRPRSYVQDVQGGEPRPLLPEGFLASLISPDGKSAAGLNPDGIYYLYPLQGGAPVELPGLALGDELLRWSDDGRFLFVSSHEPGHLALNIYRIHLGSGRRELWKKLSPPDATAVVSIAPGPGTVRLTSDGAAYAYSYSTVAHQLYLVEGLK